ncbi:MAG: hypothetical protein MJE77_05525 [Proteobacteria bacterium]|nr:hypothetical protein [Pseudomonadota bacterium]
MSQPRRDAGLHPTAGARFLLERQSESDGHEGAVYRAVIYTPDDHFEYRAEMTLAGEWQLVVRDTPAGHELENKLGIIAKLVARSAKRKLADDLPPWPHRVLRWRGPGRG